jgi:eukaryotic-like serine/threonine-protein kinase
VVGEEVGDATRILQGRGLQAQVGEPVASDHVAEGLVATQSIPGGDEVRRRTTVVLRPSLGITVPDLTNRPAASAIERLNDLQLRYRQERAPSPTVAAGRVIRTSPAKGAVLKRGQLLTVVVSNGKPTVQVPQVAGLRFERAREALAAVELGARPKLVFDDQRQAGRVVGTQPAADARAAVGSTVTVLVSKGPDLVEVPDVRGLSRDQARQVLKEHGLRARFLLPVGDRVVEQQPGPGSKLARGGTVNLLPNLF